MALSQNDNLMMSLYHSLVLEAMQQQSSNTSLRVLTL